MAGWISLQQLFWSLNPVLVSGARSQRDKARQEEPPLKDNDEARLKGEREEFQ